MGAAPSRECEDGAATPRAYQERSRGIMGAAVPRMALGQLPFRESTPVAGSGISTARSSSASRPSWLTMRCRITAIGTMISSTSAAN